MAGAIEIVLGDVERIVLHIIVVANRPPACLATGQSFLAQWLVPCIRSRPVDRDTILAMDKLPPNRSYKRSNHRRRRSNIIIVA
jgi:hypothetical protein